LRYHRSGCVFIASEVSCHASLLLRARPFSDHDNATPVSLRWREGDGNGRRTGNDRSDASRNAGASDSARGTERNHGGNNGSHNHPGNHPSD
jgi:hypothetical protein